MYLRVFRSFYSRASVWKRSGWPMHLRFKLQELAINKPQNWRQEDPRDLPIRFEPCSSGAETIYLSVVARNLLLCRLPRTCTQNHLEEAVQWFEKAIALGSSDVDDHYHLGVLCYQVRDPQRALAGFIGAVTLQPDYALGYAGAGAALTDLGQYAAAVESLKVAISLTDHPTAASPSARDVAMFESLRDLLPSNMHAASSSGQRPSPTRPNAAAAATDEESESDTRCAAPHCNATPNNAAYFSQLAMAYCHMHQPRRAEAAWRLVIDAVTFVRVCGCSDAVLCLTYLL